MSIVLFNLYTNFVTCAHAPCGNQSYNLFFLARFMSVPQHIVCDTARVIGKGAQGTVMHGVIEGAHHIDVCTTGSFGTPPSAAVKQCRKTEWGVDPTQLREAYLASTAHCATPLLQGVCELMTASQPSAHTTIAYRLGVPLDKFTPVDDAQRYDLCVQIMRFLPSLRAAKVSHNDITLANIIVTDGHATLSDFGSAHLDMVDVSPFPPNSCGYRPPEVCMLSVLLEDYSRRSGQPLVRKHPAPFLAADAWSIGTIVKFLMHKDRVVSPANANSLTQLVSHLRHCIDTIGVHLDSWALYAQHAYPGLDKQVLTDAVRTIIQTEAITPLRTFASEFTSTSLGGACAQLLAYNPSARAAYAQTFDL